MDDSDAARPSDAALRPGRRPLVVFVEDESYLREEFTKILIQRGYEVFSTHSADEAIRKMEDERVDLLLTDLQMALPNDTVLSQIDALGGRFAGMALARYFRRRFPTSPVIIWTFAYDSGLRKAVEGLGNARLISKRQDGLSVLDEISDRLEGISAGKRPRTFIVHGHDEATLGELRSLLKRELGFPEPTVLRDEAEKGRTLIEKIETEASNIDIVIALLTPDDRCLSKDGSRILNRARQNVIFEIGFFMGLLGRSQGRIILLHKGDLELPSDLHGLVSIDISEGMTAALPKLRLELCEWVKVTTEN